MNSLRVFSRVIWALMVREAATRNGKMRFGYVWVFLELALYVLGFVLFRSFLGAHSPFGENAVVYLITAMLTFRCAMGLTRRTMGAIQANIALLTYPQVKTCDHRGAYRAGDFQVDRRHERILDLTILFHWSSRCPNPRNIFGRVSGDGKLRRIVRTF